MDYYIDNRLILDSNITAPDSTVLVEDTTEIPIRPFSSLNDDSGNACKLQPAAALGIEETQVWEAKSDASDQDLTVSLFTEQCQSAPVNFEATSSTLADSPVSLDWIDTSNNSLIVKPSGILGTAY